MGNIPISDLPARHLLTADVPIDDEPDLRWLVRMWVLVAVFATLTVARSYQIGIPVRDPHGGVFWKRVALSLTLFVIFVVVDAGLRTGRDRWTVGNAAAALRRRWTGRRVAMVLSGLLAYHVVYLCYHNLKSWDVFNTVRDDVLLRADRWLFFGHSPASLLHDLLGQHVATYVLLAVYESFSSLVSVSFVAALVFAHRLRDGFVFLVSALWVWILGVGSYYLIPSLGPFNSAPQDFAGLPHTMVTDTQARYMAQRSHLLHHPGASDAFAQVSAFASLHVAFAFLILLMMRYYGFRRATLAMSVYVAGTVIATIYLGWHFVVDDLAGLLLAYLAVLFGRLMVYPRGRSAVTNQVAT